MSEAQHLIELIHRIVGYPVTFIIAPIALATFAGARGHRWAGKAYFYGMIFLYLSGLFMTLTRHEWLTWNFARNVTFNFFGFSMVLYAYRSIYLFYQPGPQRPRRLDWMLGALLMISVASVIAVAIPKNLPMRVFAVIGAALVIMEIAELLQRFEPKSVLYRRHIRYVLASHFYVLTVVSIVHLDALLPGKWKWLWPSAVGAVVIYLMTTLRNEYLVRHRAVVMRRAVLATLILSIGFGLFVAYELIRGAAVSGQATEAAPARAARPALQTTPAPPPHPARSPSDPADASARSAAP